MSAPSSVSAPLLSYHTQHAPTGAFASFTLGLEGQGGGFGQSLAGPATQSVFVGSRPAPQAQWRLLPFLDATRKSEQAAFLGEGAAASALSAGHVVLTGSDYQRRLGWASDRWTADGLEFCLHTPWHRTKEPRAMSGPAQKFAFAPVVCATLAYDNRAGATEAELIFGLGNAGQPLFYQDDRAGRWAGFSAGGMFGFATARSRLVSARQGFDVLAENRLKDSRGLHAIASEAALIFRVPAGQRREFPLVLGFYQAGEISLGLACSYYYTTLFKDLGSVLRHGLEQHSRYVALAAQRDAELAASRLAPAQAWLLAQATHSYFGSTQLLRRGREPVWVVNEGEYRMMNTFDLTVDHLFFELEWHPWAVRNTLDLFADRYAYRDRLHDPQGRRAAGGIAFTHDMGVCSQFSPPGYSSYECRDLHGCFSHMTAEQLLNWICCATTYAEHTSDAGWLKRRRALLVDCADSLLRRDNPRATQRDGLVKWDSDRCGPHGSEITTYDSLDVSLGQTRNNLYIAVKTLAAWLLLARAFRALRDPTRARQADRAADRLADTLGQKFNRTDGYFPAVFEAGNQSRILPAVEGLVFPLFLGFADEVQARYPQLFADLATHLTGALRAGVCLDAQSGAWKISSTSQNTWFSKIAIAQHVVRRLFPETLKGAARAADEVHAGMQQRLPIARFAFVDQVHSATGADLGSRYYPRGVTASLWLRE